MIVYIDPSAFWWLISCWLVLTLCCVRPQVPLSLRDVITWVHFMNAVRPTPPSTSTATAESKTQPKKQLPAATHAVLDDANAYLHGCFLILLDGLGLGRGSAGSADLKGACLQLLAAQGCDVTPYICSTSGKDTSKETSGVALHVHGGDESAMAIDAPQLATAADRAQCGEEIEGDGEMDGAVVDTPHAFGIAPFLIPRGPAPPLPPAKRGEYVLDGGTHGQNAGAIVLDDELCL